MGFQFNHVGGGTKTRRPITLHMKYNSACVQPNCFLVTEDYGEQELTLEDLQVGAADHRQQMPTGWGASGRVKEQSIWQSLQSAGVLLCNLQPSSGQMHAGPQASG